MPADPSLFARKLRRWRTGHGGHGRMTQEGLAELLGVSVDAIGKYERSQSFIRGDLEHRLAECLGWSRNEIIECREDWDARRHRGGHATYRVLDNALVDQFHGGSWRDAICTMIAFADRELGELPEELGADEGVFLPIYDTYRNHWSAVIRDGKFVAKWALTFLRPEDEALFKAGRLIESEMTVDRTHRPILPGTYYGYCPALIVGRGHEAAGSLLLKTFVDFLEGLAARDILLHGLGTISCTTGGAQICQDLGMINLCQHAIDTAYGVWDMPGNVIAKSIFARRSPLLHLRYSEAFPK